MSANPHVVVRQLLSLTGPKIGRRDIDAIRLIEKAANTIVELAAERRSIAATIGNLRRGKEQFRIGRLPRVGYNVEAGDPKLMAETLADLIDGPCDLYRTSTGGVRIVRADQKAKTGEFLGRFDDGATVDDIMETLE